VTRTEETEERRILRLEAEADVRPNVGPCLGCGRLRDDLQRGRPGGLNVYCHICAIGTRTPSQKGREG